MCRNRQRNTNSSVQSQKLYRHGSTWFIHNQYKWRPQVGIAFLLYSKWCSPPLCNSQEVAGDVVVTLPDVPVLVRAMRLVTLTVMRLTISPSTVFFSVLCTHSSKLKSSGGTSFRLWQTCWHMLKVTHGHVFVSEKSTQNRLLVRERAHEYVS